MLFTICWRYFEGKINAYLAAKKASDAPALTLTLDLSLTLPLSLSLALPLTQGPILALTPTRTLTLAPTPSLTLTLLTLTKPNQTLPLAEPSPGDRGQEGRLSPRAAARSEPSISRPTAL